MKKVWNGQKTGTRTNFNHLFIDNISTATMNILCEFLLLTIKEGSLFMYWDAIYTFESVAHQKTTPYKLT